MAYVVCLFIYLSPDASVAIRLVCCLFSIDTSMAIRFVCFLFSPDASVAIQLVLSFVRLTPPRLYGFSCVVY